MHERLQWLCDNVGGRISGVESGTRSEEWAYGLMRDFGLQRVRYQGLSVAAWQRGDLNAVVTAPVEWRLTALTHGYSPRRADVLASVIDVGHGERADFERHAAQIPGRVVLCDEGVTEGQRAPHRSEKLGWALEAGGAGLMILSSASGGLPRTGVCRHGESPVPSIGISLEDGERLRRLLRGGVAPVVRIAMTNSLVDGTARNVIGELPGREKPDEVVLAGAHLDSWDVAQGAVDNGLGAAIVLEMARALAAAGARPRRTLRFAMWAAEEVGLLGSGRYVEQHSAELPRHAAVMNFDMTGDPYGYWTPGRKEPGPLLRGLAAQLAPLGMREEFGDRAGLHSDHQAFMLAGVPVVSLLARLPDEAGRYYHSVGDTFDKVPLPSLCRAAAVGAHTMWALADAPERPLEHLDPAGVRAMIDAAGLYDALAADGYRGPAMQTAG